MADHITAAHRLTELMADTLLAEEAGSTTLSTITVRHMLRELAACAAADLADAQRESFGKGAQFGARVEQRVAVEALQQAALAVLGKDRGDGPINLGALGEEVFAS
jgi:hypothetical protein